jgi:glycosyltransferase involved in cell wall biosynthesis
VLDAIHDADVCLCDSEATRSALVARFPELQSRAAHQTLGVDDRFFVDDLQAARTAGRRALGLDAGEWVVLNVGSCVDRKRIPNVLTAFAQFAREMPRARLVQVGGRFTADQRRHAEALAIDQRVVQRPDVSEELMPSIYAAADVVVIGSAFEGFGLPVLEALAVGVPVVSTRNTALAEFPEEFVWSAGPGDGAALTAAMQSVFARPADAHTRAAAARAWARTRTWPDVARGVASIYHRLL